MGDVNETKDVIAPGLEKELSEQWQKIGICNDFVFCKVMQDEELLKELVHLILPKLRFEKLSIQAQQAVEIGMDIRGVRFDIFATLEDQRVIDIEMQVLNRGNLPKRMRFYNSMADTQMLEKGVLYTKLQDSYVIMICTFDYYGRGRHLYTFTNRCTEEPDLEMADGTAKIVLNAIGTKEDVSGRLKEFLKYVAGETSEDEYVRKLDDAVKKAKANREWRREYMTLQMRDLENREIGMEQGMERGINKEQHDRIATMLKKGKTPGEIADFCDYPLALIKEVQKSLLVEV